MRCCEACEPVGKCFDPISFECVDFQRLSQIIANLTRENLAEREAEITNLPWTHTLKKATPWQSVDLDFDPGALRNLCFVFPLSLMKIVFLWKTKMNQAGGYLNIEVRFSEHSSKVRYITSTTISCDMFRKLLTTSAG